jgi:hypothetical protein
MSGDPHSFVSRAPRALEYATACIAVSIALGTNMNAAAILAHNLRSFL